MRGLELRHEIRRRLRDGRDGRALVDDLERLVDELSEEERPTWLCSLGLVAEEVVPERERALGLYRRAYLALPGWHEPVGHARRLAMELGRLDEVVEILEEELLLDNERDRQIALTAELGSLLYDLGQRERAARVLVMLVARFPESPEAQDALSQVEYASDQWPSEVERLLDIANTPDLQAAEVAPIKLRAVRLLLQEAPFDPRIEPLLVAVLRADPLCEPAHVLIERRLSEQRRTDDLARIHEERIGVIDDSEATYLALRVARDFHERFHMRGWAEHFARLALVLGRGRLSIAGLTLLRDMCGSRRAWDDLLASVDEVLAADTDDDAKLHATLLGGAVAWRELGRFERASRYFEPVRLIAPDSALLGEFDDAAWEHGAKVGAPAEGIPLVDAARAIDENAQPDRAMAAWKRAITAAPRWRWPRRALSRLCRRQARWRALAEVLRDEANDSDLSDGERVAVLVELADVYRDKLHQELLVTSTLEKVVQLDPGNDGALDELELLYEKQRRFVDEVALLERKHTRHVMLRAESPHPSDATVERALRWKLGALHERLGHEVEAIAQWEALLDLDPDDSETAAALEAAYERRREWEKLVLVRWRQLDRNATPDQAAQLDEEVRLARLAEEKAKKLPLAIAGWNRVLALHNGAPGAQPAHDEALAQLERLYGKEQLYAELAAIHRQRATHAADVDGKVTQLTRLAQLHMLHLPDSARATAAWEEVLALQPHHPRAHEALRRLYLDLAKFTELRTLYGRRNQLDEYTRLLATEAESLGPEARLTLYREAAEVERDLLQRPDSARAMYERVLALDADDLAAAEALIPLYEARDDAPSLAQVLATQLRHSAPADKLLRIERLALLHERSLGDLRHAFGLWRDAFATAPTDASVRRELERTATHADDQRTLIALYQGAVTQLADAEQLPLLTVLGARLEAAGSFEEAVAVQQRILSIAPTSPTWRGPLEALERLYLKLGRLSELGDVYDRQLALLDDAAQRRPVRLKLAELAERLGEDTRAVAALETLLEEREAPEELEALGRIHRRHNDHPQLAKVLERQLALLQNGRSAVWVDTAFALAELERSALQHFDVALALYRRILDVSPKHAGALQEIEGYLDRPEHALAAAEILSPRYQAARDYQRLVAVRRIQASHADESTKIALLVEAATLLDQKLGLPDQAFDTLGEALITAPLEETVYGQLETLARATSGWERLADLLRGIASKPAALDVQIAVRTRLGRLYAGPLHEIDRAIATYRRVLDLDRHQTDIRTALIALLQKAGRAKELAELAEFGEAAAE